MRSNSITTIQGLTRYISENSNWSTDTVINVINNLGYRKNGGLKSLKELSATLANCAKHGADSGFHGFTNYDDTLSFFQQNRRDIAKNLELSAEELGTDVTNMVRHFGVFRYDTPPSAAHIEKAIWGRGKLKDDLTALYNVFAWFCLEEIAHTWYRYLEDNPGYYAELSA